MKNSKGFTLVELVIVIIIIGILSIVAVPIYSSYMEKSKLTEGKTLTGAVFAAEQAYYSENGIWYELADWVDCDDYLTIDARGYMYFNKIIVRTSTVYPDTMEVGAMSSNIDREVFQYWSKSGSGNNSARPKWVIFKASDNSEIAEEK